MPGKFPGNFCFSPRTAFLFSPLRRTQIRTVSFLSGILSPFCQNLVLRAQKYGDAFSKKHFTNVKEITII